MQYLTPAQVRKVAPAISRRSADEINLVDTVLFLRHLASLGYMPCAAFQGTPHSDASAQSVGRHLAVTANRHGEVIAILNSHTVCRRAWLGAGHLIGWTDRERRPDFMIGAVVPLPRWRGVEEPLEALQGYQVTLATAKDALDGWGTNIHQRRWMARNLAATAYLPGHKTPLPQELLVAGDTALATTTLALMIQTIHKGNLLPDAKPVGGMKPRRLKPIQSPDALFKAANAAFQTGIAAMAKYKVANFAFPSFNGRDSSKA